MKLKLKKSITLFLGIVLSSTVMAQMSYINKEWNMSNGNTSNDHENVSCALDPNGNLVYIGSHINNGNSDIFLNCIHPNGNVAWQQTCPSSATQDDWGTDLKIDANGNIYVCGVHHNGNNEDYFTAKYDQMGNLLWQNFYNGNSNGDDQPSAIDFDANGNVYVTGTSYGGFTMTDFATIKYDVNGNQQWVKRYNHSNKVEIASDIVVNNNGDILVLGTSANNFENSSFVVLKYSSNGNILATKRHNSPGNGYDYPHQMVVDANDNIYVVGTADNNDNLNFKVLALTSNLTTSWVNYFDKGFEDVAKSIDLDANGNIYIAGTSENYNSGKDYITIKYDVNGNEVWNREFGSEGNNFIATAENLKVLNNEIIVTGTLNKNNVKEYSTIKYTSDGKIKFVENFDAGNQNNEAKSVIVKDNSIYVTGVSIINGVKQNTTVKYSNRNRPINIVTDANGSEFVQNELIIRFDKSAIIYNKIDDKKFTAGVLSEFVKPNVITQMNQKTGLDWAKADTYKMFLRMTTADSISVTRLGETIKLDDYWATLVVYIPVGNVSEQNTADSLNNISQSVIHYAERDFVGRLHIAPNDNFYTAEQTALFSPVHGIEVEDAWDKQVGQTYTKVGVYDSGINWRHEDYGDGTSAGSKVVGGWDYFDNVSPFTQATPDPHGHGTATSGIIGALRNNNIGVAGVAGGDVQNGNTGCQLFSMSIPVLGETNIVTVHSIVAPAIVEGSVHNPNTGFGYGFHIQNHSWGSVTNSITLRNSVKTCYENNCVFVVSSGNDADPDNPNVNETSLNFPASYNDNWVIKVGANDASGNRAIFSTFGNDIDVIAPGTNDQYIALSNSTNNDYVDVFDSGNPINGTSFSAPMTAGVSALLYSEHHPTNNAQYPNILAPEDVEVMLQSFATDITNTGIGYDQQTGFGRVDANESLNRVSLPYRVRHFQQSVNTSTATLVATNQTVNIPLSSSPIPLNSGQFLGTTADIYQITVTLPHSIPVSETYLSGWVRNSSCDLYGYNTNGGNPIWANVTLDASDQNSATLTGYIYRVEELNIWLQTVDNIWLPVDLNSTVNFAYSIYTLDNDPNVGVDDKELENSFNIYPNPTNNQITINFSLEESINVNLKIYDAIGKIVYEQNLGEKSTGKHSNVIDVSNFSKGLYLCKLQVGSEVITKQLIKQ